MDHSDDPGASRLRQLATSKDPNILEEGVKLGRNFLGHLESCLQASASCDPSSQEWIKNIKKLQARTVSTSAIVGVFGNTGAGKSSLLNALLDEERLLPTNCMRACTAAPTEISYNFSDDQDELYRAEIEFISHDDWANELRILVAEFSDGGGADDSPASSEEAEVAAAKIRAVYPTLTKQRIVELANNPSLDLVGDLALPPDLGSTKKLRASSAAKLYLDIQGFVDSKNKRDTAKMEFWPLIKVVRIYTKASALSTGAILVDLPGVQDSNPARASVSKNYLKNCNAIWVVAPISRAVSDKAAQSLLDDSFKLQLKYDGTDSAVTFICTKTDDILVEEAAEEFHIPAREPEKWNELETLTVQMRVCEKSINLAKQEKCELGENSSDEEDDTEARLPKRRRVSVLMSGPDNHEPTELPEIEAGEQDGKTTESTGAAGQGDGPLPGHSSGSGINHQNALADLDRKIRQLRAKMKDLKSKKNKLLRPIVKMCLKGRNNYSRGAIKRDFVNGYRELDNETRGDDEANIPMRDYSELANSLQVFCVSSRAYQTLNRRMQKSYFNTKGFECLEDTEIPQLKEHLKNLTKNERTTNLNSFFGDLIQLLNSMRIWSEDDGTRSTATRVEEGLGDLLRGLDKDLQTAVKASMAGMRTKVEIDIIERYARSVPSAAKVAPQTVEGWGDTKEHGGVSWSTYRATARRNGSFVHSKRRIDFNEELLAPITITLSNPWVETFRKTLPLGVEEFATTTEKILTAFHDEAVKLGSLESGRAATLSEQSSGYAQHLKDRCNEIRHIIRETRTDANRLSKPIILKAMAPAYKQSSYESGSGMFDRMKRIFRNHIELVRDTMFDEAGEAVKARLLKMLKNIEDELTTRTANIHTCVSKDYHLVLVGTPQLSIESLQLRKDVALILQGADSAFAPVIPTP